MSAVSRAHNPPFSVANPVDELLREDCDLDHDISDSRAPMILVSVGHASFLSLVDTGSEVSCVSFEVYQQILVLLPDLVSFPVQSVKVTGAFQSRSQKVTHQIELPIILEGDSFIFEFLVIPNLQFSIILGADFLRNFNASIVVDDSRFSLMIPGNNGSMLRVLERFPIHNSTSTAASLKLCSLSRSSEVPILAEGLASEHAVQEKGVSLCSKLTCNQDQQLTTLLDKHASVFSDVPGRTTLYQHEIHMLDSTPFAVRQYPIPVAHRPAVQKQIDEMENLGLISRSDTPFASPLLTTLKKDGSVRLCLDARKLNSAMKGNCELPRPIEDIVHNIHGVKYISSLDLTASYWQIPIHPDHRHYTGFRVGTRAYHFNVLPFGLKTAVGSFTRCMDLVLRGYLDVFVFAYVDDLLIVSATFEEHIDHLHKVLTRLHEAGLTLNRAKCFFCRDSARFLGYLLDSDGLRPDPERVVCVQNFPTPRSVHDVQSFLGLVNFDRGFIPGLADLTEPLTRLLRKGSVWRWGSLERKHFDQIKAVLAKATLLHHPVPEQQFYIECDASDVGIGGVLFQMVEGSKRIVAYMSRSLLERERRYSTPEKELLGVVEALRKWRVLLLGRAFTVRTDHHALQYLRHCRLLSPRISRWILVLQEYEFKVEYIPGKENVLADILSRHPPQRFSVPSDRTFSIAPLKNSPAWKVLLTDVSKLQHQDLKWQPIMDQLSSGEDIACGYVLSEGMLFKLEEADAPARLCLPVDLVDEVISAYHVSFGHFGAYKTWCALRRDVFFVGLYQRVKKVISTCLVCQVSKHARLPQPSWEAIIPTGPRDLVSVDFYGPLPRSTAGVTYLLVAVDVFSKWVALYPLKRATTAAAINRLEKDYFPNVGVPKRLLADHGTQFTSKKFSGFLAMHDVQLVFSSVRHPQGNPAERTMRELGRLFRAFCSDRHPRWAAEVRDFAGFLNNVLHESTGFTPCQLHFGTEPKSPLRSRVQFPGPVPATDHPAALILAVDQMSRKAALRAKLSKDYLPIHWEPGDQVLLKVDSVPTDPQHQTKKCLPLFEGPFTIK